MPLMILFGIDECARVYFFLLGVCKLVFIFRAVCGIFLLVDCYTMYYEAHIRCQGRIYFIKISLCFQHYPERER